jgi:hypothetical protein
VESIYFVDYVDLVARTGRAIGRVAAQLADIVDAGVAGRVDLDHVDILTLADRDTCVALAAGRRGRGVGVQAVERLGQNSGHACLAHAARAREQVTVMDAFGLDGVDERGGDRLLADDLLEVPAAILAGKNGVSHGLRFLSFQFSPSGRSARRQL